MLAEDYAEIVDEEGDYSSPARDYELDRARIELSEIIGEVISQKNQISNPLPYPSLMPSCIAGSIWGCAQRKLATAVLFRDYCCCC